MSRRPNRLERELEDLTRGLIDAIFAAIAETSITELTGSKKAAALFAKQATRTGNSARSARVERPNGVRAAREAAPRTRDAATRATPARSSKRPPQVEEPFDAETTITDPLSLLESPRSEARASHRPVPPPTPSTDEIPAPAPSAPAGPVLRENESLVRSSGGGTVIRRRRQTTAAA